MSPNAYKNLPAVREALAEKNYKKAQSLVKKLQGKFSESYAPLGTLLLEFNDDPFISDYYRELDIDQAIAKVKTESNTNTIEREYLVSNPDKVFVIHLKSKKPGALGFIVRFESLLLHTTTASNNFLQANGVAPVKAEPNYVEKKRNAIIFDKKRGTRFTANIQIKTNSGKITNTDSSLSLANATEATIYISMATSFNGYDKDPAKQGLNQTAIAQSISLDQAWRTDLARREQLLGRFDSTISFLINPIYLSNQHQPNKYLQKRGKSFLGKLGYVDLMPVQLQQQYVTDIPFKTLDGPMLASSGYQVMVSAGVYAKLGPLTVQLQPQWVNAQMPSCVKPSSSKARTRLPSSKPTARCNFKCACCTLTICLNSKARCCVAVRLSHNLLMANCWVPT